MIATTILLVLTLILNIIDYVQTMYAIQLYGISVEINPFARLLIQNNLGEVVKIIIAPLLLVALWFIIKLDRKQIYVAYIVFILYLLVVLHNFAVLF